MAHGITETTDKDGRVLRNGQAAPACYCGPWGFRTKCRICWWEMDCKDRTNEAPGLAMANMI